MVWFWSRHCIQANRLLVLASLFCLLCCIAIPSFANATPQISSSHCPVEITHIATAKSAVEQERPRTGWQNLQKLPDTWNKRWPDYHGIAWYKIQFKLNCDLHQLNQPIAIAIQGITQSGRVYINDALLWQDYISAEHFSRSQHQPRLLNLPSSSLKQGVNTIWVQVYGSVTQKSGLSSVQIGEYQQVYNTFKIWLLEQRQLVELNTMINFVVAVFFFLAWLANRNERAYLWLTITGMCWVFYSLCIIFNGPIAFLTTAQVDRIQNIIFCFYTVFGCIGAWYFANHPFPKIQKLLLSLATIAALCIGFAPEAYLKTVIQICFSFFVLVFMAKCISYPYLAYKAKMAETYLLATLYLIYLPIAVHDAHFMMTMEGHALSPYTGPLTTLVLGGVLALRLARHTRQIERFNKTLTENVQRAELKLATSLGQQHQLALENARLQERIHLSHDLHDGLGGSIVRSILLLEQNDKIEKPQIMSMLKLFRNDLRQVIDSGSSIGTKVPDTPIEWAAPIRHRFVQLFEELDMSSSWKFAAEWIHSPTATQCLNLTRVAEETLTNILKHSQASKVQVSLCETETQLILRIEDNGIGFNPNDVEQGLHVGLHSMQTRIHRIGGEFKIQSQPGCTVIEAILPFKPDGADSEDLDEKTA